MDKTKITLAATKYAQKGQYDKAISEYRKILEKDPKDVRILLKIGELQQKKGENEAAASTLEGVANAYAADGFFLKAVAVFKQVLKLSPERVEVILRLADLYQQLGLMSDAMGQLQAASSHYDKHGAFSDAVEILRRMISMEPENVASRLRLAEHLVKLEKQADALQELRKAAETLRGGSRIEDYLRVGDRIVQLDPKDQELGRELAQAYLAKSDVRRALERLQLCFQQDPKNAETLDLLARAFLAVGQRAKAASVYKELARVHRERAQGADEQGAWKKVLEVAPDDAEARQELGLQAPAAGPALRPAAPPRLEQDEAPPPRMSRPVAGARGGVLGKIAVTQAPAPAPAPAPAVRAPAVVPQPEPSRPAGDAPTAVELARLLTETDVFVKYGLADKAREHLKKIFALDPNNLSAHEKAVALSRGRDPEICATSLARVAHLYATNGYLEQGRPHFEELKASFPEHAEIARLEGAYAAGGAIHDISDDDLIADAWVTEGPGAEAEILPLEDEPLLLPLAPGEEAVDPLEISAGAHVPVDDEDLFLLAQAGMGAGEVVDEPLLGEPGIPGAIGEDELFALANGGEDGAVVEDPLLADPGAAIADDMLIELATSGGDGEVVEDPLLADPPTDDEPPMELSPGLEYEIDLGTIGPEAESEGFEEVEISSGPPLETIELVMETRASPEGEPATRIAPGADGRGATELALLPEDEILERTPFVRLDEETDQVDFDAITAERDPITGKELEPARRPAEPGLQPEPPAHPGQDPVNPWRLGEGELEEISAEIDEAEFYLQQGLLDEAEEIYRSVDRRIPGHAQAGARLASIASRRGRAQPPAPAAEAPVQAASEWGLPDPDFLPAGQAGQGPAADGSLELGEEGGLFDLGAALAAELAAEEGDAFGGDVLSIGADVILEQFKEGVARTIRPEDVETHYNLAIAYKEMGLLADAISEFEVALSGSEGDPRAIDCLTMIGICHGLLGNQRRAVDSFVRGLGSPGIVPETEKALHYEIGQALEALGDLDESLASFGRVARIDGNYRDVRRAIARLVAAGAQARPLDPSPGPVARPPSDRFDREI